MAPMTIQTFDHLLAAARAQPTPQRLLLVFAAAELDDDATPAQRAAFEAGHGGALAPSMCVDKSPAEIADFAALCDEARSAGAQWAIVFAAALSADGDDALDSAAAAAPLQRMVEDIRRGAVASVLAFNTHGDAVQLD